MQQDSLLLKSSPKLTMLSMLGVLSVLMLFVGCSVEQNTSVLWSCTITTPYRGYTDVDPKTVKHWAAEKRMRFAYKGDEVTVTNYDMVCKQG